MKIERMYSAANDQSNCLNGIADPEATIGFVASLYADCKHADLASAVGVEWTAINRAIEARWPGKLDRVKELANEEFRTGQPVDFDAE